MKLVVLLVLCLIAPVAIAGDYCRAARQANRNPANDPRPVVVQGIGAASVINDDSATVGPPPEAASPFGSASPASRPGPQASAMAGGGVSATSALSAQARGGTMSSPQQRADREIRRMIRRLR